MKPVRQPGPIRIDPAAAHLRPLELDPRAFQSPLPVQNYHMIFEDEAIGLVVGLWDTTTMQEAFGPYPTDEFITVLEGSFSIVDEYGAAVSGHAGQSATFRHAIPVSWKQEGYLSKIYLTLLDPAAETPQIASAAGGVKVLERGMTSTAEGTSGRVVFRNDAGTMSVVHRIHGSAAIPAEASTSHELCRVLSGEMILADEQGVVHRFGANDHVFIPSGAVVARKFADGTEAFHVFVKA